MIDITKESMLPLAGAVDWLKGRGIATSKSAIYTWVSPAGCSGVRLETLKIGTRLHTSHEALQRFFAELTQVSGLG